MRPATGEAFKNSPHDDELVPIPLSPDRRDTAGVPIPLDIRSNAPLPMVPLNRLPVLTAREMNPPQEAADDASKESSREPSGVAWRIETSDGAVWIEGDSILCACPDCQAPMSIRLWLKMAHCWRCDTEIELTEEQQRAVDELLAQRSASGPQRDDRRSADGTIDRLSDNPRATSASAAPVDEQPVPATARAPREADPLSRALDEEPTTPTTDEAPRRAATVRLAIDQRPRRRRFTPAWLVSLILHFVLLLLLALLAISDYVEVDSLTLSSFVSTDDEEGGMLIEQPQPEEEVQFELPLPDGADLEDPQERRELEAAADDAQDLREDDEPVVEPADISLATEQLTRDVDSRSHFAARDPRFRVEMVTREGGSTLSEAAVARGLAWLARFQNRDGSWSLEDYESSNRRSNQGDAAATALALLPFLGAGQTHEYGRYKETVAKGLMWLLTEQAPSGDLRAGLTNNFGMYAHGQATIVLVEALALSGDERFRDPAQRAVDFIVKAQHDEGGWRYRPGQEGDTSVLGWQMMALQSARSPGVGLKVPDTTLRLAEYYLDLCSSSDGAKYSYQPNQRRNPTPTMTAEALLCRMYLGWQNNDPRVVDGMRWLAKSHSPSSRRKNIYYWYYATQAFHNYGGEAWEDWNQEMRDILVRSQTQTGRHAGSWSSNGYQYGDVGGRIYVTALSICTLEVYYRHLPIFRRIEMEVPLDQVGLE